MKLCLQDKATAGKQGLGIKDRPKKIAGVRYQGKKTSFDNSDDDDNDDEEEEEESEEDDDKDSAIENSLPAKRKRDEIIEPKIKLKNLCKQILKKVCCQFTLNNQSSSSITSLTHLTFFRSLVVADQ